MSMTRTLQKGQKEALSPFGEMPVQFDEILALLIFHCWLFCLQPFTVWYTVFTWNSQMYSCMCLGKDEFEQENEVVALWDQPLILKEKRLEQ